MKEICQGKKLIGRLKGDACLCYSVAKCEICDKFLCYFHILKDKHECKGGNDDK